MLFKSLKEKLKNFFYIYKELTKNIILEIKRWETSDNTIIILEKACLLNILGIEQNYTTTNKLASNY